jgi:hypothetical protein
VSKKTDDSGFTPSASAEFDFTVEGGIPLQPCGGLLLPPIGGVGAAAAPL